MTEVADPHPTLPIFEAALAMATPVAAANPVTAVIVGVLQAAIAFAKAGLDPQIEIERILSADPALAKVRASWDDYIRAQFHKNTDPPSAP